MKRQLQISVILLLVIVLAGCAAWQAMTTDQKARWTMDLFQVQLEELWDQGKAYLAEHPEYEEDWKRHIAPAFDIANRSLKEAMDMAQAEDLTVAQIRAKIQPLVNDVMAHLTRIGLFAKKGG